MFEKILIAGRGEIAIRIARTCDRLGIATVAIHSDAEAGAPHTEICTEAAGVGGAALLDSYLNVAAIVETAKQRGAQAIHPCHGALAESAAFARVVSEAGLTFIGPPPDTLELFHDKLRCRQLARLSGVRAIEASAEAVSDLGTARSVADELGYPLMVKPVAGRNGLGLRRVDEEDELEAALAECHEQARLGLDDDRIYLERYIPRARHLEVQLLLDAHEQCVALGERECSVQRHYRSLIEESPAPGLSSLDKGELKRAILLDSASRIAKEGAYQNLGTAEFLLDADGGLHFMEWTPRLQVQHAVTEMCTGVDLVEQQIRIAAGERLERSVTRAQASGHSMQARLYAEDASQDFTPTTGEIKNLRWPTVAPGALRVETGLAPDATLTTDSDPLVAQMVTYSQTRHQALLTLDRVLAETVVEPLLTNLDFLRRVLGDEAFRAGQYDCELIQRLAAHS